MHLIYVEKPHGINLVANIIINTNNQRSVDKLSDSYAIYRSDLFNIQRAVLVMLNRIYVLIYLIGSEMYPVLHCKLLVKMDRPSARVYKYQTTCEILYYR